MTMDDKDTESIKIAKLKQFLAASIFVAMFCTYYQHPVIFSLPKSNERRKRIPAVTGTS